jgi:hypothetical protein
MFMVTCASGTFMIYLEQVSEWNGEMGEIGRNKTFWVLLALSS